MTNYAPPDALTLAISLFHLPSHVRAARAQRVPAGIEQLLRMAAGEARSLDQAARNTGRSPDALRAIASFAIEQLLLYPGADSYRVLGATPGATDAELRTHMALLLRWLHPDHQKAEDRAVYARRVTAAWENLKTSERRANYDRRWSAPESARPRTSSSRGQRQGGRSGSGRSPGQTGLPGGAVDRLISLTARFLAGFLRT